MPLRSLVLLVVLLARPAAGQATGATVSGVVHDSIARQPLAGATIQLVTDSLSTFIRTAVSDSLGRFALGDVPSGRYKLGFLHPLLDSLGVDAPLVEVRVRDRQSMRADLAIPSPARIRAAICGPKPDLDSSSVLVGVVRDARGGNPASGVTVTGEWLELTFTTRGVGRRIPRLVATTGDNGWFAMCNVPSAGTLALRASRGADSTDLLEVPLSSNGFVRSDLYLGPARETAAAQTTGGVSGARDVRLSGTVIAAAGGSPLPGAQVSITSDAQTRTNERGEWTLVDPPGGTRMLEVRAVGYYPERRPVNVVPGAPPVRVALSTFRAVLDTVRITAARVRGRDIRGFVDRSRSGVGHYLAEEDIARRRPLVTSDLFRTVPGLMVERAAFGDTRITMRGSAGGGCEPSFYLDGQHMRNLTAADIDDWVRPHEIAGVEVYAGAGIPGEFNQGMSGCGAIVIWTK
ncbi:MAG TPA: carboxypeptidase regulatory-like domain-containing protein [Gemmatimonadaceae bacterium]|nr:carboxypeptidase regulatory-like domain-containing protein [Gemmatimonadaceae bacterium]